MKPVLIGLCGGIGAGKGTVAEHLRAVHGFEVVSFASPLKRHAMEIFGLDHRHVFGTQADKSEVLPHVVGPHGEPRTGRKILEHLGTEGVRALDPDAWVKLGMRTAQRFLDQGHHVVFDDVRFGNEIGAIQVAGGSVWALERRGGPNESTGHVSDTEWREKLATSEELVQFISAVDGDLDGLRHMASSLFLGMTA